MKITTVNKPLPFTRNSTGRRGKAYCELSIWMHTLNPKSSFIYLLKENQVPSSVKHHISSLYSIIKKEPKRKNRKYSLERIFGLVKNIKKTGAVKSSELRIIGYKISRIQ